MFATLASASRRRLSKLIDRLIMGGPRLHLAVDSFLRQTDWQTDIPTVGTVSWLITLLLW
jgi:hypothetical protein